MLARSLLAVALLGVSTAGPAQEPAPASNLIRLTIARDGKVVGTPALTMQVGRSATISVGGQNGYALRASLATDVRLPEGRRVDLALYFLEAGGWTLAAQPAFSTTVGNTVRITLPDASGKTLDISGTVSGF